LATLRLASFRFAKLRSARLRLVPPQIGSTLWLHSRRSASLKSCHLGRQSASPPLTGLPLQICICELGANQFYSLQAPSLPHSGRPQVCPQVYPVQVWPSQALSHKIRFSYCIRVQKRISIHVLYPDTISDCLSEVQLCFVRCYVMIHKNFRLSHILYQEFHWLWPKVVKSRGN